MTPLILKSKETCSELCYPDNAPASHCGVAGVAGNDILEYILHATT